VAKGLTIFGERAPSHSARFRQGRAGSEIILEIRDAPTYQWPDLLTDTSPPVGLGGDLLAKVSARRGSTKLSPLT
jgi:hypothetical protein